ncbi:MAG: hypothetical protein ABI614_29455, partial [Planctomycetota bacterium]
MARKSNGLSDCVGDLQRLARNCLDAAFDRPGVNLASFRPWLAKTTGCELSESEFRDVCAEALAWAIIQSTNPCVQGLDTHFERTSAFSPFLVELLAVLRSETEPGFMEGMKQRIPAELPAAPLLLYESYLSVLDPKRRSGRGVFYTPQVIARHIVERIDTALRERFGLADGLADTATWIEMRRRWPTVRVPQGTAGDEPFVRILDPAAGSGVFLVEVVDRIHRTLLAKWRDERLSEEAMVARWNAYVPRHLLPRIHAVELMPTPSVISQIAVAQKLAETGYDFRTEQRFRFSIADTLLDPAVVADFGSGNDPADGEASLLRETLSRAAFTVILGNPPFRGISSNPSSW